MFVMLMMSVFGGPGRGRAVPLRSPESDWGDLIERAGSGEQQALAKLYDQSSRLIYSVALRILGNPADAEEVTLDVYSQVWRSAKDYSTERGTASSWLILMARSRALDRVRSRGSRQQREFALEDHAEFRAEDESAEETAWLNERKRRVRDAIEQLAPEQREAIELSFFDGMSHSELAERLNQPLGTVKTRIRLGMIKLRQALGTGKELQ